MDPSYEFEYTNSLTGIEMRVHLAGCRA